MIDQPQAIEIGLLKINRELFIETIESIEKQYRHDEKCGKAFQEILKKDFVSTYDNHHIQDQLVKLLRLAMGDTSYHSWIEYFMWDLDFGSDYKEGDVTISGREFPLRNAADLWEFFLK